MSMKKQSDFSQVVNALSPAVAMVVGGGVGLVAMGLLPAAVAPYAPALGVLGAGLVGPGRWPVYVVPAAVVAGLTVAARRPTVQTMAGALTAAKAALTGSAPNPEPESAPSAQERGKQILRQSAPAPSGFIDSPSGQAPYTSRSSADPGTRAQATAILDAFGL